MPVFDDNGKMITSDRVNTNNDFPNMKGANEISKIVRKKPLSSLEKIRMTCMVLAVVAAILFIGVTVLVFKVNSLNKEITALSFGKQELDATHAKLQETIAEKDKLKAALSLVKHNRKTAKTQKSDIHARVQKPEKAVKRKPQPIATSNKPK
jgi:hypothetical protein